MLKRAYSYTVLRYVHDPLSAEFINVGIVLFSPATVSEPAILKAAMRTTSTRVRTMFPDLDCSSFVAAMRTIERQFDWVAGELADRRLPLDADVGTFAREVLPADDSALRWAPFGGGQTSCIASVVDQIYARFITLYDE